MAEILGSMMEWTFIDECPIPKYVNELLIPGEEAVAAYKTIRDAAVFTNKRLIIRDTQGLTGKKTETFSIPYKSINMYSTENAGHLDFNAEIELWTRAGHMKLNLKRSVDVAALDRILAKAILD